MLGLRVPNLLAHCFLDTRLEKEITYLRLSLSSQLLMTTSELIAFAEDYLNYDTSPFIRESCPHQHLLRQTLGQYLLVSE